MVSVGEEVGGYCVPVGVDVLQEGRRGNVSCVVMEWNGGGEGKK
jgi:hypothetical protein